ncbi:MAG: hypothetical protein Q4B98_06920, partial [Cutibacterium sp.]|nr:hypothetical protein [Cutibacterium sp.]
MRSIRGHLWRIVTAILAVALAVVGLQPVSAEAADFEGGGLVGLPGDDYKFYDREAVLKAQPDFTNRDIYGWQFSGGNPVDPFGPNQFLSTPAITRDGQEHYGWCIDPDAKYPFNTQYTDPGKLDRVTSIDIEDVKKSGSLFNEIPFDGHQKDAVVNVAKKLGEAWKAQDHQEMKDLSTALAILLNSWRGESAPANFYTNGSRPARGAAGASDTGFTRQVSNFWEQGKAAFPEYEVVIKPNNPSNRGLTTTLTKEKFRNLTGYEYVPQWKVKSTLLLKGNTEPHDNALLFEWKGGIPQAAPEEYITVMAPLDYSVKPGNSGQNFQRVLAAHQPGIPDYPAPEPEPQPVKVTTVADKSAQVGAEFGDVARVTGTVPEGAQVTFQVFRKGDVANVCTAPVATTKPVAVPAGTHTDAVEVASPKVTVEQAGTYYWVETLTDADGTVLAKGACGAADEVTTVTPKPVPVKVTTVADKSAQVGAEFGDVARVTGTVPEGAQV